LNEVINLPRSTKSSKFKVGLTRSKDAGKVLNIKVHEFNDTVIKEVNEEESPVKVPQSENGPTVADTTKTEAAIGEDGLTAKQRKNKRAREKAKAKKMEEQIAKDLADKLKAQGIEVKDPVTAQVTETKPVEKAPVATADPAKAKEDKLAADKAKAEELVKQAAEKVKTDKEAAAAKAKAEIEAKEKAEADKKALVDK